MGLKILLINPNRMLNPPVIPIGLEYLATALEKHNHDVNILDLCFASFPIKELKNILDKKSYDIVGLTIRNIDSCIYFNNEFYLPEFKKLIECVKKYEIPVVLGGAGFSAMPNEILEYLQADYGIIGPSEKAFPKFLELWQTEQLDNKIINGWNYGIDDSLIHIRAKKINYQQYLTTEGIVAKKYQIF